LSEFLKDPPELWLRNEAHGSIRIQEGQPFDIPIDLIVAEIGLRRRI
jgi:hypothetical protein